MAGFQNAWRKRHPLHVRAMKLPLLFFLLAATSVVHAVGADSCRFEGRTGSKIVRLKFIEDAANGFAYGSQTNKTYSYCVSSSENETSFFIKCAESKDTEPIVIYELRAGIYACVSGCGRRIVKRFREVCESDC